MIDVMGGWSRRCDGVSRRSFLRAGSLGLAGAGLSDVLRAEASAAASGAPASPDAKSVILVWLDGGPPQHETYDPKPGAPSEYRGPLGAIDTAIPGVQLGELLPIQARLLNKVSLIRSMRHSQGDHFAAAHWMLTGFYGANAVNLPAQNPSMGSVIAKLKGAKAAGIPAYVGLPHTHSVGIAPGYHGGSYLGVAYHPFNADGDPNTDAYRVPNLTLPGGMTEPRLEDRRGLLASFDSARRDVDQSGLMEGLDRFTQQAYDMVSGPAAREAFDLSKEDPRLRDRYGRHTWGQSALLARRLVEAGTRFVTLTFGGWDWHADIANGMKSQLPITDHAVGTLIEDLDQRGLLESTMVIVMGEFGRTPRINPSAGRDHWGDVMSILIGGGGINPGVVVGASNSKGEVPRDRPVGPADLVATVYRQLGIDPAITFHNHAGRPIAIGGEGRAIQELC